MLEVRTFHIFFTAYFPSVLLFSLINTSNLPVLVNPIHKPKFEFSWIRNPVCAHLKLYRSNSPLWCMLYKDNCCSIDVNPRPAWSASMWDPNFLLKSMSWKLCLASVYRFSKVTFDSVILYLKQEFWFFIFCFRCRNFITFIPEHQSPVWLW